ncbi:MAG: chorismate mutase [Lysobacteraceae bacterium]|nr:MAG: chorismate mutase [Xanthomonadaceae bacterium]
MVEKKAVDLGDLRNRIDQIDQSICLAISERASLMRDVLEAKKAEGTAAAFRPEREAQVLRAIGERNPGPLANEVMTRLFREIMSACLAQQVPLKVAYLGPEGTFTHQAVLKQFGHAVRALGVATIEDVFTDVEQGHADLGVVPVENSTEGAVNNTLDMFVSSPLKICGEVDLAIHHNLLSSSDKLSGIERVYAHPQALAQCRGWLHEHLPETERIAVASNAEAARRVQHLSEAAAIASEEAATLYGLNTLASRIEDQHDNTTRFLVIGSRMFPASGKDRTSLLLAAHDRAGALYDLLQPLARRNVSMTRIESRPSKRGKWDYVFFVDVLGHAEDEPLRLAIDELRSVASKVKVLGSYPAAIF